MNAWLCQNSWVIVDPPATWELTLILAIGCWGYHFLFLAVFLNKIVSEPTPLEWKATPQTNCARINTVLVLKLNVFRWWSWHLVDLCWLFSCCEDFYRTPVLEVLDDLTTGWFRCNLVPEISFPVKPFFMQSKDDSTYFLASNHDQQSKNIYFKHQTSSCYSTSVSMTECSSASSSSTLWPTLMRGSLK